MTREEFRQLTDKGILFLDGATGTNLQKAGMPHSVCPELWILEHKDILKNLQEEFIRAGSNIIYAPTFGGNRIKLGEYGLEDRLQEINRSLVRLSLEASGGRAYVAGDLTMTGRQLSPIGDMQFEELVDIYKEQISVLADAGADLLVVETMMSLNESRAALIAARETCDLPVMVTLTFESDGRTLFGSLPECAAVTLQGLGADAIGLNCSTGPGQMLELVKTFYRYSTVPVIAKPNAGLPELVGDKTVYRMGIDEFALGCEALVDAGARIIGGCCGSTPEHIKAMKSLLDSKEVRPAAYAGTGTLLLSSERRLVETVAGRNLTIIGERINPTGKKAFAAELREGKLDLAKAMAAEQERAGALVLDVNCGVNGIDEKKTMLRAIEEIGMISDLPLSIDSSYPEVIEEALRIYPGRALINSISLEKARMKRLMAAAKKYGAAFVILPVSDEGIPESTEEKHRLIMDAVKTAMEMGLKKEDMVVDALVATVGANPKAAMECLETISFCSRMGLLTVCGLSNISFGLPQRAFVNAAFLSMAVSRGLNLVIANPTQDLLMNAAFSSALLMDLDNSQMGYINRMQVYSRKQEAEKEALKRAVREGAPGRPDLPGSGCGIDKHNGSLPAGDEDVKEQKGHNGSVKHPVFMAVMNGESGSMEKLLNEELGKGAGAQDILEKLLIPAINQVGVCFEKKQYFLPQLIASANAMKTAVAYLKPMLGKAEASENAPLIVIATVEGDVHDIGKNLVTLMLENYGYRVSDLGKNVPAADIVASAVKEDAAVIALSALMTTTMMNMKKVIEEAAARGYEGKIIVGGAAVTDSFAAEIGADGYSSDAADCVRLVNSLLGERTAK